MRLSLRFVFPLVLVVGLIGLALAPLVERATLRWFIHDVEIRSSFIATSVEDPIARAMQSPRSTKLRQSVSQVLNRGIRGERLFALALCDARGRVIATSANYPTQWGCAPDTGKIISGDPSGPSRENAYFVSSRPLVTVRPTAHLVIVHDLSFAMRRSAQTKFYWFALFAGIAASVSLVAVVIARRSLHRVVSGARTLIRSGFSLRRLPQITHPELKPLAKDLRALVRELEHVRQTRDDSQINWTAKHLKQILKEDLAGDEVLIVSNREPYVHSRKDGKIEVQVPASGLVTALEPVMRACSGTWIAYGGGDADRDTVDAKDHVQVPPEHPSYQMRRVWLTPQQVAGYYYGFSNEGIWPLCHIAHVRPTFRSSDWDAYVEVNQKFANAVVEEAKTEDPVVLIQDFHLALLPKMVREKLPNATIITFWHVPWPNPESFGICPWREEILEGLLGSSILGFHTRFHCNNFVDTVDRYLEARIDREDLSISFGGKMSLVRNYPISIEWPPRWLKQQKPVVECRAEMRLQNSLALDCRVVLGVDRLDYTKGILERFAAVERLIQLHPEWAGQLSFVQIAAPSRSEIPQYQIFFEQVCKEAERINLAVGAQTIVLRIAHHTPEVVFEYYRGADVCFVSSLHDGMNLVAKEFVAARDDEQGVLVLSQFTGAARELPEALIINPYDTDQCAEALQIALGMSEHEQRDRMRSMRGILQQFNVYRWAGKMLIDAARMRKRERLREKLGHHHKWYSLK